MSRSGAIEIASELRSRSFQAWLVGGCVRDLVLGREPKDYDIATDARPEELLRLFPRAQLVGALFGVVLVDGVEVATFRSDHAYADGRHPEGVTFETDPKQDVLRRDFTMNALLLDPAVLNSWGDKGDKEYKGDGEYGVVDYVGGLADLRAGLIRAIGDPEQRFEEDHLRMLRAVRFAARFKFEIEPVTWAAIQKLHAKILRVSPERIRDELVRILTEGGARRGFELLDASGLLRDILPEVAAMQGVAQPPEFHPEGDVWTHTLIMLEGLRAPAPALAFGVLLHDVGKPPTFVRAPDRIRFNEHDRMGAEMTEAILRRLRFSNDQIEKIVLCVRDHMKFQFVKEMRQAKLKRLMARETFPDELELHHIDCASSHRNLESYEFLKAKAAEMPPEVLKPAPLLTGHDLLALGLKPGPSVGQILHEVEELQLEERLKTRAEALEFAKSRVARQDGAPT